MWHGLILSKGGNVVCDGDTWPQPGVLIGNQRLPCDTAPCLLSPQAFHYMSFAILVFFMLEIFFKIFVFRLEFFHHKFEILDAFVVVVSFVLDLVLLFKSHHFEALGLLILLRLWRVARIINGIIISVKTRSERQILRLKQINIQLATKIQHLEFSCSEKVRLEWFHCCPLQSMLTPRL